MKKLFEKYLKTNLGLINLFGKVAGRLFFLALTSYFAFKLSFSVFASFAIFWTTIRMFTFLSSNNLYIIYFNKARESLIENKSWSNEISMNIFLTLLILGSFSCFLSYFIFRDLLISLLIFPILLLFTMVRNISEFSKSDNSVYLSIFIEDFLFYFLFFISGVTSIYFFNNLLGIVLSLLFSIFITTIIGLYLFKLKFRIRNFNFSLNFGSFSIMAFKTGINYTFLRGNELLSNFGVRYIGQFYYGDIFVSYTHIMFQFYNVFTLITMSVISGFQSKITLDNLKDFSNTFIINQYKKILKTIFPFIVGGILIIILFNEKILNFIFPKYSMYNILLVKVSLTGLLYMFIQPLIFIFIYNKKISNLTLLNLTQYIVIFFVYCLPFIYENFDEEYWLILIMTLFIIVQGLFTIINYKKY